MSLPWHLSVCACACAILAVCRGIAEKRVKRGQTRYCWLQVTEPIRFLMDLPQLNVVMMGKQEPNSSWMPQSTIFLVDLAVQFKLRDPTKDVLRLSALGLGLPLT